MFNCEITRFKSSPFPANKFFSKAILSFKPKTIGFPVGAGSDFGSSLTSTLVSATISSFFNSSTTSSTLANSSITSSETSSG